MRLDDLLAPLARLLADREQADPSARSTPSTAALKAAPRKANWTRCWARTSTLAPTSRKRTGLPGTGSCTASAGRCTPLSRRRPKVAAAIVAPVEPRLTIASARALGDIGGGAHDRGLLLRPHRAAPGRPRCRSTRSVGDHLDPVDPVEAELAPAGRRRARRCRRRRQRRAPSASTSKPCSAPNPSRATVDAAPGAIGYSASGVVAVGSATLWEMTSRPA